MLTVVLTGIGGHTYISHTRCVTFSFHDNLNVSNAAMQQCKDMYVAPHLLPIPFFSIPEEQIITLQAHSGSHMGTYKQALICTPSQVYNCKAKQCFSNWESVWLGSAYKCWCLNQRLFCKWRVIFQYSLWFAIPCGLSMQSTYIVLSEKDIRQRQEEAVTSVATVLNISPTQAGILLRHFKWYCYLPVLHRLHALVLSVSCASEEPRCGFSPIIGIFSRVGRVIA